MPTATDMPQVASCRMPLRRAAGFVGVWLLVLACASATTWDAEVEAAWQQAVKKARPKILEHFHEQANQLVKTSVEDYALTEEQKTILERTAPELARASARHMEEALRQGLEIESTDSQSLLRNLQNNDLAAGLQHVTAPYSKRPEMLDDWAEALRQVLPPEDFAAWEKDKIQRLEERQRKTREFIQSGLEKTDPAGQLEKQLTSILNDLRFEKLNQAGQKQVRQLADTWKNDLAAEGERRTLVMLDMATDETLSSYWQQLENHGGFLILPPLPFWLENRFPELLEILPPANRALLEEQRRARAERARLALRKMRVMIVELMTPLDESQRQAVAALAAELPEDEKDALLSSYQMEPWQVWQEKPAAAKLAAILDDIQERLWTQGIKQLKDNRPRAQPAGNASKPPERHPGLGPPDPSLVEAAISEHLAEESAQHAQRGLLPLLRRAAEAVRVAGLDESARAALELAARGAMQARVEEHRRNQSRYLRSQMQGATAQNIRQRLAVFNGYSFSGHPHQKSLFDEQLDDLLGADQKKCLSDHQQASLQRRHEAQLDLLLARLDLAMSFSADQFAALQKSLATVMQKYGEDMDLVFSSWGERMPWFFQSYYAYLPAAGLEENDLRVLNERQQQLWEEQVTQQGGHYWDQVLEIHEQRRNALQPNRK